MASPRAGSRPPGLPAPSPGDPITRADFEPGGRFMRLSQEVFPEPTYAAPAPGADWQVADAQTYLRRRYGRSAIRLRERAAPDLCRADAVGGPVHASLVVEPGEACVTVRVTAPPEVRARVVLKNLVTPPLPTLDVPAQIVLRHLRDRTGQWCTMRDLRDAVYSQWRGDDPVVLPALVAIAKFGIGIECVIHWVVYSAGVGAPYIDTADPLVDPRPLAPVGGRVVRENVWRLP